MFYLWGYIAGGLHVETETESRIIVRCVSVWIRVETRADRPLNYRPRATICTEHKTQCKSRVCVLNGASGSHTLASWDTQLHRVIFRTKRCTQGENSVLATINSCLLHITNYVHKFKVNVASN